MQAESNTAEQIDMKSQSQSAYYQEFRPVKKIAVTVAVLLAFILLVLGLFLNKMFTPRVLSDTELRVNGAFAFDKPRILNEFTLLTQDQSPFGLADLTGHWSLIYFGFTSCPDVCPTTLATLQKMVSMLDSDVAKQTQVIFVSVDPGRDSTEIINDYLGYFNSEFIGLTGNFIDIKRFANQLNVPFQKVKTGLDSYTVDHGSNIAIINPLGHYHGFLKFPLDAGRGKLTFQSMVVSF